MRLYTRVKEGILEVDEVASYDTREMEGDPSGVSRCIAHFFPSRIPFCAAVQYQYQYHFLSQVKSNLIIRLCIP